MKEELIETKTIGLPGFEKAPAKTPLEIVQVALTKIEGMKNEKGRDSQRSLFEERSEKGGQADQRTASRKGKTENSGGVAGRAGGEVNESQNYTVQEPKAAIDFKLKKPEQIELQFGEKGDSVFRRLPIAKRRVVLSRPGGIRNSGTILHNARR